MLHQNIKNINSGNRIFPVDINDSANRVGVLMLRRLMWKWLVRCLVWAVSVLALSVPGSRPLVLYPVLSWLSSAWPHYHQSLPASLADRDRGQF